ncbi:hypothetical protein JTB14_030607 [Gonioctena quinquepunctata]|nr:hypothetical protein JTB14_030607 [Gonioctena quinquepunctata]
MAYYHCDYSSDSDGFLSDDGGYYEFKEKLKSMKQEKPRALTDTEKLEQNRKLLYSAICSGNKELAIEHINNGCEVNMNLEDGWTPLLLSASTGNAELTKELIERGADVNSRRDGITALMMACNCPKPTSPFTESLKVIERLVDNGANPKSINRKRMTALMFSANVGNLPAVKYLLPLSDKNAEDNQRWTVLFWAVNGNEVSVVEYLLQQGLDYNLTDVRNNTPLDIAKNNDFMEIIDLFPKEETDIMSSIIDATHNYSFVEIFSQTKSGEKPKFFLDICNILCGAKAENMIKKIAGNNISLDKLLSISNEDLKDLGVNLPYQRYRISAGIHRFHKHPFHPRSLHVVKLDEVYSNADVAVQLLTTIKQMISMEACLSYIVKNQIHEEISKEEQLSLKRSIQNIKRRIKACRIVTKELVSKTNRCGCSTTHNNKADDSYGSYNLTDVRNNTPFDTAKNMEITDLFPKEETDMSSIIDATHDNSVVEIFSQTKSGEKPTIFLDICNIFCRAKAENIILKIADNDISLDEWLSISNEEFRNKLPYQRYRILAGIYKFHNHPFHPKSLHVVKLNEVYSNRDVAVQLLTTIKQMIAMEACFYHT